MKGREQTGFSASTHCRGGQCLQCYETCTKSVTQAATTRCIQTPLSCHTAPKAAPDTPVRRRLPGLHQAGHPKMHLHSNVTFGSPSTSAALEQLESHMQLKNQRLVTSYLLLEIDCKVLESKHSCLHNA